MAVFGKVTHSVPLYQTVNVI